MQYIFKNESFPSFITFGRKPVWLDDGIKVALFHQKSSEKMPQIANLLKGHFQNNPKVSKYSTTAFVTQFVTKNLLK